MVSRTTRRIAAAALATAAALGAAALPAAADSGRQQARPSHVKIAAVQYDSPGRDDRSKPLPEQGVGRDHQRGPARRQPQRLDPRRRGRHTYTFRHYLLRGHESVRIHTGQGRDRAGHLYQDRRHYVWDNHSETATLQGDNDRRIDRESCGRSHGGGHWGGGTSAADPPARPLLVPARQ